MRFSLAASIVAATQIASAAKQKKAGEDVMRSLKDPVANPERRSAAGQ